MDEIQLTTTELELMQILWRIGQGSVKEVMQHLPAERNLAYTSVSTIIRILEKKGFVAAEKVGRGHSYKPLVAKKEYEKSSIHTLVNNTYMGGRTST